MMQPYTGWIRVSAGTAALRATTAEQAPLYKEDAVDRQTKRALRSRNHASNASE